MASSADWRSDLEAWLEPFVARLGRSARRTMCCLYMVGLIGAGERKSIAPMAERLGMTSHDALHHFVSVAAWDETALEEELARQADRLVGGADAYLIVDDTALPKKGSCSVGVAPQYASALGT
jgi:SRSO17 transposase